MLLSLKSIWVFDLLTLTNPWNYLEAVQVHLSGIKSVKWQPSSNHLLKKIPQFFGSTGHSYSTSSSKCVIRPLKVTKGKKKQKKHVVTERKTFLLEPKESHCWRSNTNSHLQQLHLFKSIHILFHTKFIQSERKKNSRD